MKEQFSELVKNRRSIRQFSGEHIPGMKRQTNEERELHPKVHYGRYRGEK